MERRRFLGIVMTVATVSGIVRNQLPTWNHGAARRSPVGGTGGNRQTTEGGCTRHGSRAGTPWTTSASLNTEVAQKIHHQGEPRGSGFLEITAIDEEHDVRRLAAGDAGCVPRGARRRGPPRTNRRCTANEASVVRRTSRNQQIHSSVTATFQSICRRRRPGRASSIRRWPAIHQAPKRRSSATTRHRSVVLAVRRGDHRQPGAGPPVRLLADSKAATVTPLELDDGRRGADPDVLVDYHGRGGEVRPRRGQAARVRRRDLRRCGRDAPAPCRRTSSSRSPRRPAGQQGPGGRRLPRLVPR